MKECSIWRTSCFILMALVIILSCCTIFVVVCANKAKQDYKNQIVELNSELLYTQQSYRNSLLKVETIDHTDYSNISGITYDDADILIHISKDDVIALAKMAYGESGSVKGFYQTLSDGSQRYVSNTEQIAACYWTVFNRVDAGYSDSILKVITAKGQFTGYSANKPVKQELVDLAYDCIIRWQFEKILEQYGITADVGRVLPKPTENEKWCWFAANKTYTHNLFRSKYSNGAYYDWSLATPYTEDLYYK